MNNQELSRLVSAHFTGAEWARLAWTATEVSHAYIELCKLPFLRWGEKVADKGKYLLGVGLPVIILFIVTA